MRMTRRFKEKNACPSEKSKVRPKRIFFQRSLTATAILVIAVAVLLTTGSLASADECSKWIKNLSAVADPDGLYLHNDAKVATSGNFVHVMWISNKLDWTEKKIFYARSTNGGKSFLAPVALVSGDTSVEFPAVWNNLAASGSYVHVLYAYGWPSKLVYLRSQDNGATFQGPVTLFSEYTTYNGAYIAAQSNKVALIYDSNNRNGAAPKDIICDYSTDGGATFNRTVMAHSEGTTIFSYNVQDAVRSGDFVYVLTSTMDENWFSTQQHLYLWASTNGGATFKAPVKVNVQATNGGYYLSSLQDVDYSPNLAVSGEEVNVVWVNVDNPGGFDGWMALTLRVRRSSDAGTSLEDPLVLHTFPEGYDHGAKFGQETIVCKNQNVYVSTVISSGEPGTYLWSSSDGGVTWGTEQQISHGGWWPLITIDPLTTERIHLFNGSYFRSDDAGEVFDGGVNPRYNFGAFLAPQLAMDSNGIPHYVWGTGNYSTSAILYRQVPPEPKPGWLNKAVGLEQNTLYGTMLGDNLQISAQSAINFSETLTVEFWVNRLSDDDDYFQNIIRKKLINGLESYKIGAWYDMQIYATIITDATPGNGVWLGTGIVLPKDKWTHIAMTYNENADLDNWCLYVNGNLAAKTTVKGLIQTDTADAPLVIGNDNNSVPGAVAIDELRLWNSVRTRDQIYQNMRRTLKGTEEGLVSYYNFNSTFKELTGHGTDALPMYHETYVKGPALKR